MSADRADHLSAIRAAYDHTGLAVADGALAAAVHWYSIIATPPGGLPHVWQELDRALDRGGWVLVSFQAGDGEGRTTDDAYGSGRPLTLYTHAIDHVVETLHDAGLDPRTQVVRRQQLPHETSPQAHVVCRRTMEPV